MNKLQWKVISIFAMLALALALCPSIRVSADDTSGTISGTITDDLGNPINGDTVSAVLLSDGTSVASTSSNSDGSYTIDDPNLTFDQAYDVVADGVGGSPDRYFAESIMLTSGAPDYSDADIQLTPDGGDVERMTFNVHTGHILSDLAIRQAIAYGTDRQTVLKQAWVSRGTTGIILNTVILPELSWTAKDNDPDLTVYDYNPTHARSILNGDGWSTIDPDGFRKKDGVELTLKFITTDYAPRKASAALFKAQMAAIGINIEVYTGGDVWNRLGEGDFDIAEYADGGAHDSDSLMSSYQTGNSGNNGGYSNPDLDTAYNAAQADKSDPAAFKSDALDWQHVFSAGLPALAMFTRIDGVTLPSISGNIDLPIDGVGLYVQAFPISGGDGECDTWGPIT